MIIRSRAFYWLIIILSITCATEPAEKSLLAPITPTSNLIADLIKGMREKLTPSKTHVLYIQPYYLYLIQVQT